MFFSFSLLTCACGASSMHLKPWPTECKTDLKTMIVEILIVETLIVDTMIVDITIVDTMIVDKMIVDKMIVDTWMVVNIMIVDSMIVDKTIVYASRKCKYIVSMNSASRILMLAVDSVFYTWALKSSKVFIIVTQTESL